MKKTPAATKVTTSAHNSADSTELVLTTSAEPRVDSRLLAKQLGGDHANVFELVTNYRTDFEQLGVVRFQTEKPLATAYAGECVLSQSFSAASMRVCQPAPVALKAATTSGDNRMVVDTLVGAFCGPRGLIPSVFCNCSGSTSVAGLNLRISAALSSRTSPSASISGARGFIVSNLSGVGLAKADDTNAASHGGKAQHRRAA